MKLHYLEIVASDADAVCAAYEAAHGIMFGPPDPLRDTEEPIVRPYWLVDDIESVLDAASKQGAVVAHPPM